MSDANLAFKPLDRAFDYAGHIDGRMRGGVSEAERAERDLLGLIEGDDGAPADASSAEAVRAAARSALAFGAMIRTLGGEAPVETLAPGDLVETLEDGPVAVVAVDPLPTPGEAPVIAPEGAFGAVRATAFGPDRRIFWRGGAADLLFGAPEVLIRAADLPSASGACRGVWSAVGAAFALRLERPALIWTNGVLTESAPAPAFAAQRPVLKPMEASALLSFTQRR
ncbi:MAG: Hint domain-containing protein [Pseudomonadota bacterium]